MTGFLAGLFETRVLDENSGWGLINKLRGGLGDWSTPTGLTITPERGLELTAVYAAVRIISEGLASLPLVVYKRLPDGGKERDTRHGLYKVLHDQPNPHMTSFMLRETLQGHLCTWGNAYAEMDLDGAGRVRALWPLRPDQTAPRWVDGQLYYVTRLPERVGGGQVGLPAERVFPLRGISRDGMTGYSPIRQARNALGLAAATEEYGGRFFGNGARPGGVLEHPEHLSTDAHARVGASWNAAHQGLSEAHRVAILEEGMTYKQIGIPPEDAQFLQTRKFQVSEIARMFLIPPHRLGDLERATFSNIEQLSLEFVIYTLRPWLVRWEQEMLRCIFLPRERETHFAEFLVDGLLRGDIQSRYTAYHTAWGDGWITHNEIRALENLNPVVGGDTRYVPLNMVPVEQAGAARTARLEMERTASVSTETLAGLPGTAEAGSRAVERRARSAATRRRLMLSQRVVITEAAERIIRREARDILTNAKKLLGKRSLAALQSWLDEYYQEHKAFVQEAFGPTLTAYAELVAAEAAEEAALADLDIEQVRRFTRRYLQALADRHAYEQVQRTNGLLLRAQAQGVDAYELLEEDVNTWTERLPKMIGQAESVRLNGAVSVMVYALGGVLALTWNAFGESCPYCQSLNGRKVGIQEWFLKAGESLRPEGADEMKIHQNTRHPPAHNGCDCLISTG